MLLLVPGCHICSNRSGNTDSSLQWAYAACTSCQLSWSDAGGELCCHCCIFCFSSPYATPIAKPSTTAIASVHNSAFLILNPHELRGKGSSTCSVMFVQLCIHSLQAALVQLILPLLLQRPNKHSLVTISFIVEHGEGDEEEGQHQVADKCRLPHLLHR